MRRHSWERSAVHLREGLTTLTKLERLPTVNLNRRRRSTAINIVPLIDVLVVLLFFFLMTMQFREPRALDVTPPPMLSAGQGSAVERLVVEIAADGRLAIDGVPFPQTLDELAGTVEASQSAARSAATRAAPPRNQDSLQPLVAALRSAAKSRNVEAVLLRADQDAPLRYLTTVIDAATEAQLNTNVRLLTR